MRISAASFPMWCGIARRRLLRTAPAPMFLLSRLVNRSGYKVVLTGEGADEFLAGYDIFKEAKIRAFWSRQPGSNLPAEALSDVSIPISKICPSWVRQYLASFFGETADGGRRT